MIHRVIECLRGGENQTLWQSELPHPEPRRIGIKQGYPLSPFIFNLMMEAVLISVEEETGIFKLDQSRKITLPIVLAYADDILVICKRPEDLERIVVSIKEYLSSVGLKLNDDKCHVIVRDPNGPRIDKINILGRDYDARTSFKYLGVTLTLRLDRPMTTRMRCRNTVKTSRAVMEFLKKRKPSWELGRLIYETVLAPAMLYGTQTSILIHCIKS